MTVQTSIGKITADKETIHRLLDLTVFASSHADSQGYEASKRVFEETFHQIFDALDEVGYYDDVK